MKADRNDLQALQQAYQVISESHGVDSNASDEPAFDKFFDLESLVKGTMSYIKQHPESFGVVQRDEHILDDQQLEERLLSMQDKVLGHQAFQELTQQTIDDLYQAAVEEAHAKLQDQELTKQIEVLDAMLDSIREDFGKIAVYGEHD